MAINIRLQEAMDMNRRIRNEKSAEQEVSRDAPFVRTPCKKQLSTTQQKGHVLPNAFSSHKRKTSHFYISPQADGKGGVPARLPAETFFVPGLSGFHDGRGVPGRTTLFIFYDKYPFYDLVFPYLCTSRDVSCPCWPMLRERRMR